MVSLSSILSTNSHIPSYDYEAGNLYAFFTHGFDLQTTDHNIINKYIIYIFNLYTAANDKDFNLWECILADFGKFEMQYFD